MATEPTHAPHAHSPLGYYLVFAALIVLTATTVAASYIPLGEFHTTVAMLIAATKATLIVLIFMHGLESGRLVWMVITISLLFLLVMWGFTYADYATRGMDAGVRDPTPATQAAPAPRMR